MNTIECHAGDSLYDVLSEAVERAPARFEFNEWVFETRVGETLGDARQRFKEEHNFAVLTDEESAEQAKQSMETMRTEQAAAIAKAKVPTEAEMLKMKAPTHDNIKDLTAYIESLVDRPHDYGTCVYAMSFAAVAAFNFVSRKLGVTGFQASCADMDILRQTRNWSFGRILDYEKLLYPQYCNEEHFPSFKSLLADPDVRKQLAELARENLKETRGHPDVRAHWNMIANA